MRWPRWFGLLLVLVTVGVADAQPPATPTPKAIIYCRDGSIRAIKRTLVPGKVVCVLDNHCIGVCDAGAAGTSTFTDTVTTAIGQSSAQTAGTIASGATIVRCLATTASTITGGYNLGLDGADGFYGSHISGAVGGNNAADTTYPPPHTIYAAEHIVVTAPDGGTFSNVGTTDIACSYHPASP